ncbi:MAG: hypothetical protein MUC34_13690 [Anaerolineae bacterium]|jgi:hypothetical protein|nr:hypothetical protein [Anaerolineae bacterium]
MAVDPNWLPVEELPFVPPNSEQIALATGGGVLHLVWAQAKIIYHARRVEGAWSAPVKVAAGEQPSLAVTPDGAAYCAHANWFIGNREIYVTAFRNNKWGLPALVSRTTGHSSDPALHAGADGKLRLVWADTTPGDSVIYYAQHDGQQWPNAPLPNGKGSRPSVAASADATHVVWQDRLASSAVGAFDVLASLRSNGGEWALPHMVSDTRDLHSMLPQVAVSAAGACHAVWQEERDGLFVIRHAERWPEGWTEPADVSDPLFDARLARILPNRWGQMQVLWAEGNLLKHRVRGEKGRWLPAEVACEECVGLSELAATISDKGELHAVFTRYTNGDRHTYYAKRKAIDRQKVFLPIVTR